VIDLQNIFLPLLGNQSLMFL